MLTTKVMILKYLSFLWVTRFPRSDPAMLIDSKSHSKDIENNKTYWQWKCCSDCHGVLRGGVGGGRDALAATDHDRTGDCHHPAGNAAGTAIHAFKTPYPSRHQVGQCLACPRWHGQARWFRTLVNLGGHTPACANRVIVPLDVPIVAFYQHTSCTYVCGSECILSSEQLPAAFVGDCGLFYKYT